MSYRIFPYAPTPQDGTSWYRFFGVFPHLRRLCPAIEFTRATNVDWTQALDFDLLWNQRPFIPGQVQLTQGCKQLYKVPVASDWDDDLFNLMPDNPVFDQYNAPQSKQNVEFIARASDVITVSTAELARVFSKFNPNVYVIPNAINTKLFPRLSPDIPRGKLICFRGGPTHRRDIATFATQIMSAYEKNPDWSWSFMGYNPWELTERMNPQRCIYQQFTSEVPQFIHLLQKQRAAIQIICLNDNKFNHSKSRVGFLEATLAGSVVLAPDWEEWRDCGAVLYTSPEDFGRKLENLMNTPLETLGEINNKAWEWVEKNATLDVVNPLRLAVLKKHGGLK